MEILIEDIKEFAIQNGLQIKSPKDIIQEARDRIRARYNYSTEDIKNNFDQLLEKTEAEAHQVYLDYEQQYGQEVYNLFLRELISKYNPTDPVQFADVIKYYFKVIDKFHLSIAQSRKSRAGQTFENIHNSLFKILEYPFDEQKVINGKPDFLLPSENHFRENPMDCIIFTAKRTLRERWRQIVTEGTRGLGFYLATIDDKVSANQLNEMRDHRIYIVCPENLKREKYSDKQNVLSFRKFFKDHLDPAMERWRRNGVI